MNNIIRLNGGGGVRSSSATPLTIKNTLIYENDKGIEFSNANSVTTVRNNTIVYNDYQGIYVSSGNEPNISNCILWGNDGNELDGCSATYCCIESGADPNNNNIGSDPCFVNIFDFLDQTDANGTTTTIIVADANLYEANDVIEYDDDGIVRTVNDVNTTTDTVTFTNALGRIGRNSTGGEGFSNWTSIYGECGPESHWQGTGWFWKPH